jgi:hypothetical protein
VLGPVDLLPSVAMTSLSLDVASGNITGTAATSVSGTPMSISASIAKLDTGDGATDLVASLTLTGGRAVLCKLLSTGAQLVQSRVALILPEVTATNMDSLGCSDNASSAEMAAQLVLDPWHGIRMLNVSLTPPNGQLSIGSVFRRLGISWPDNQDDVVGSTGSYVRFVPDFTQSPAAPSPPPGAVSSPPASGASRWSKALMPIPGVQSPGLSVGALFSVPSFNLYNQPGWLDIGPASDYVLKVSALST